MSGEIATPLQLVETEPTQLLSLHMVMPAEEILSRIQELQRFVKTYLVAGEDYGIIPGTQKPTLYKPGAEKLCDVYALTPLIEILESVVEQDPPYLDYTVKCRMQSRATGHIMAEGVGNANSQEERYRWRWVFGSDVPPEVDKAKCAHKEIPTRKGRSTLYRIPTSEVFTLKNTLLKQAKKRAFVDAVLSATRSSGILTQDLEDLPDAADQPESPAPPSPSHQQSGKTEPSSSSTPPAPPPTANKTPDRAKETPPNQVILTAIARAGTTISKECQLRMMAIMGQDTRLNTWTDDRKRLAAEVLTVFCQRRDEGFTDAQLEQAFLSAETTVDEHPWGDRSTQAGLEKIRTLQPWETPEAEVPLPEDLPF